MSFDHDLTICAQLTKALLALPVCKSAAKLDRVIEELSFGIRIDSGPSAQAKAEALIQHCATNPRTLPELFRALHTLDGGSLDRLNPLATQLDAALARSIQFAEWAALDRLLDTTPAALSDERTRAAFARLLPHDPKPESTTGGPLWQTAVERLAEKLLAAEPDSSHPLFGFLELCRDALPADTTAQVVAWETSVATRLQRDLANLRRNPGLAPQPKSSVHPNRLQIVVRQPTECDPDHPIYSLRAWFRSIDPDSPPKRIEWSTPNPDEPSAEDGISPEALREILPRLAAAALHLSPGGHLLVEVALPLELLSLQLDTVPWDAHSGSLSGEVVPIVVRSLDRIPGPGREDAARHAAKWARLAWTVPIESVWAEDQDDPKDALAYFSLAPMDTSRPDGHSVMRGLLMDHALPLAVWLREKPSNKGRARKRLSDELIDTNHRDWPERARELRQKKDLVLPPFTLLWDDPTSLPPTAAAPLRNPS